MRKKQGIGIWKIISNDLKYGKHNVQAKHGFELLKKKMSFRKPVCNVEGSEEVIEALGPHVLGVEDNNTQEVPNKSKRTRN